MGRLRQTWDGIGKRLAGLLGPSGQGEEGLAGTSAMRLFSTSDFRSQGEAMTAIGDAIGFVPIGGANSRTARYKRYVQMCMNMPPLAVALGIRSQFPFLPDRENGRVIRIKAKNQNVITSAYNMYDRVNMPEMLPEVLFERHQLGDWFSEVVIDSTSVRALRKIEQNECSVIESREGTLLGYYRGEESERLSGKLDPKRIYQPWQVRHVKNNVCRRYGISELLYSTNRVREYQWMILAMLFNRIFKSTDREEVFIDMSDAAGPEDRKKRKADKLRDMQIIRKFIDGNDNLAVSTANKAFPTPTITELTQNSPERTGLKIHPGQRGLESIGDVEHIFGEAFCICRVPKRLLNLGPEVVAKAELVEADRPLAYANIFDQQWMIQSFIRPTTDMHLYLDGMDPTLPENQYEIFLHKIDTGEKKAEAMAEKLRAQLFEILQKCGWNPEYLMQSIYQMTPEEIGEAWAGIEGIAAESKGVEEAAKVDEDGNPIEEKANG